MSFAEAVRSALTQYATFTGRARRSEYWYFVLFNVIVSIVASIIDAVIGVQLVSWIVTLGLLVPGLAVTVRRLHDTGRSGWWILIGLVPLVGAIILIVFACQDSQPDNQYGPSPKGGAAPGGYGPPPPAGGSPYGGSAPGGSPYGGAPSGDSPYGNPPA